MALSNEEVLSKATRLANELVADLAVKDLPIERNTQAIADAVLVVEITARILKTLGKNIKETTIH